ncbi:hypothetical protein SFOMI_5354 [Sphingobium fuliginis]|uniref:Uncharacterized protein n=1 Tax=Sphingobium fuliginis (strain ATCC 27551) TaxID=336203 RepID=A0A292ZPD1_SPHSA|nr:hypothetical protein SFOMI_5354 [Sphingobium fuliginis]
MASARSSMTALGAQMPSGAAQAKLPFTLPPRLAQPVERRQARTLLIIAASGLVVTAPLTTVRP